LRVVAVSIKIFGVFYPLSCPFFAPKRPSPPLFGKWAEKMRPTVLATDFAS
jgi:hypothetical protein